MSYHPQFGTLLNQYLAKLDRSPAWLARRLDVKASTVGRWLNDGARPGSPEMVIRIADALGSFAERERLLAAAGYGYQEANQAEIEKRDAESAEIISPLSIAAPIDGERKPSRTNLPQPFTKFIGRSGEISQLTAQLINPHSRLLTLIGPGGVGKTRLAIEVARQLWAAQTKFVDGVYFISMAEHNAPEQLSYAIAEALGLAVDVEQEIHSQLLLYLHDKSLLLVLDNFEHRLDAAERVAQLLHAASSVQILVTSRERLYLPGEQLFLVHGLDYDNNSRNGGEGETPAAELFVQSAKYVVFDLAFTKEEMAHVTQICRQVEGMPLGIELAASWSELLSPAEISAEIQRGLDILAREQRSGRGEHRSIRAIFESTWQRLDPVERQIFARLSTFRDAFTREAAEQVAGASLSVLSALASKSLIQHRREDRRYALHALLHQFAEEKLLAVDEEVEQTYGQLCEYYSDFMHRQAARLKGKEHVAAMAEIEDEVENFRVAWQWATIHKQVEVIDRCLETLQIFFESKSWFQEGATIFGQALSALEMENPASRQGIVLAKLLTLTADMSQEIRFHEGGIQTREKAYALYQRSIQILEKLGAYEEMGLPLGYLVALKLTSGDVERAIQYSEQALAIYLEQQNRREIALTLYGLGICNASKANYPEAIEFYRRALAICEESGDVSSYALILSQLADALRAHGEYAEAIQIAQKGLEANYAGGNKREAAKALQVLSEAAWNMGDFMTARHFAEKGLALYQEMGFVRSQGIPRTMLGYVACSLGDYREARHQFYLILEPYLKTNTLSEVWGVADASLGMSKVLANEGKLESAVELLDIVINHPTAWQETKKQAAQLMAEIMAEVPVQLRSPRRSIEEVIVEVLRDQIT